MNTGRQLLVSIGLACIITLIRVTAGQAAPTLEGTTAVSADSAAAIQARRDVLFKQMLAEPANLDVAFEYATLSAQVGDLEAAVSTLERMLIFSPGLPRIQLELGALYYRLGAFETARGFFVEATSGVSVPPEVRERVDIYLAAIDRARAPARWSGSIFAGVRWDSNVNSGPSSSGVNLNGVNFNLDDTATANADYSLVISGGAHYAYDLGNQGDRIEADLLIYDKSHYKETGVDVAVAELTLGPSFNLKRFGIKDAVLGTYAIGNVILLGEDPYFYTAGAGIRAEVQPDPRARINLKTEARRQWYENSNERPNATDRDGYEFRNAMTVSYQASSWLRLVTGGLVNYRDTDAAWLDRLEYGAFGAASLAFGKLGGDLPWILSLSGGYTWRDYETPDPTININDAQKDREYWARLAMTLPLTAWLALVPQVEYRNVDSNYDTATYDNLAAMIGLAGRF